MNGLLHPTAGRVLVDGVDLKTRGLDLRHVRQKVGLVFQYPEAQLFGETIYEDIAFGPRNLGLSAAEVDRRVRESLEAVGLPATYLDRSPFGLSGGQARRVALAGILAMAPRYLILDEPTAGLDPVGREEILTLVRDLNRTGITVILVSHSMDDVANLAEQVLVMHQGRVAMTGTPKELFARRQKLEAIGLGVPAAADLIDRLRARGWSLPGGAVTLTEAVAQIAAAYRKGVGQA
jgi:energy-coupling factor transport system ATP-binding protein